MSTTSFGVLIAFFFSGIAHSQISAGLGYQSVQYFSRQFKNLTGMTPTEYSSSIKALAENSFPE